MPNIIQVQKIINTRNEATKYKEYAQKKVQDWSDIVKALHYGEVVCDLLLDKNYVMNLHGIVEKQEEISTQAEAQPSENEEKQVENIQEPSVVEQEMQDAELSVEEVAGLVITKESELQKKLRLRRKKA